jgi:hypothetical protein
MNNKKYSSIDSSFMKHYNYSNNFSPQMNKFLNKILFKKKIIARNLYNLYNIQELLLKMFKAEIEFYKLKKL